MSSGTAKFSPVFPILPESRADERGGPMKRDPDRNQPKLDHVQVRSLNSIIPAPENENVYRPIAFDDPEIRELAKSIKMRGVLEPLLMRRDGFIISGHRRRIGSLLAGLKELPVKIHPISRERRPKWIFKTVG
jgi:hypothetical protein